MRLAWLLPALLLIAPAAAAPARPLEPVIENPAVDPDWIGLWVRLAAEGDRSCRFQERRFFPFRAAPVILSGQLRFDTDRGLSLQYLTPERRLIVIDDRGVLMRDSAGRTSNLAPSERSLGPLAALLPILEFDLPRLLQSFTFRGRREGEAWNLTLVPRTADLSRRLRDVRLAGDGTRLRQITVELSARQRVEILLLSFRQQVAFTPGELSRYFR